MQQRHCQVQPHPVSYPVSYLRQYTYIDYTAALRQYLRQYTYIDYTAGDWLDNLIYALPLRGLLQPNHSGLNRATEGEYLQDTQPLLIDRHIPW